MEHVARARRRRSRLATILFSASVLVAGRRSDSSATVTCGDPLGYVSFDGYSIEPDPPTVGQDVVVHFGVQANVFNLISVQLNGAEPLFEGQLFAGREATFDLKAVAAGESDLSVTVDYWVEVECYDDVGGTRYYAVRPGQTKTSASAHVRVYGVGTPIARPHDGHPTFTPTPTPTPTATPTSEPPCDIHPTSSAAPPNGTIGVAGLCYFIHSGVTGVVYFDDRVVTSVHGDTPGNFSGSFTVPGDAGVGRHEITLRLASGAVVASSPFTVLPFCGGDCDEDGAVTSEEQARGVEIALLREADGACPGIDVNHDGVVEVDDLVLVTATKLGDCVASLTPVPVP